MLLYSHPVLSPTVGIFTSHLLFTISGPSFFLINGMRELYDLDWSCYSVSTAAVHRRSVSQGVKSMKSRVGSVGSLRREENPASIFGPSIVVADWALREQTHETGFLQDRAAAGKACLPRAADVAQPSGFD